MSNLHDPLTTAQRAHIDELLQQIDDPELKAAIDLIFMKGLHDFGNFRFVIQDDIRLFTERVEAELTALRGDVSKLSGVVGQLDSGLTIAEHLTAIVTEQELLPAVRGLRDDIAHLVEIIGKPSDDDERPLMARQVDTERGLIQLRGQVAWLAPVAAVASVALILAAAAVITLLLRLEPAMFLGMASFLQP